MDHMTRRFAVAALLATSACSSLPRAPSTRPSPPLWQVTKGASQVTLFGQMPIPKDIRWLTPAVRSAFEESSEVWFENPEFDPITANAAIRRREALGGPKLGEVIGDEDRKRLARVLDQTGRPANSFDALLVWQSYLGISALVDSLAGVDPMSMPERELKEAAKRAGKRIESEWQSMDEIMAFSARQTPAEQLHLISKTLDGVKTSIQLREEANAWASGDVAFATAANDRMRQRYPALSAKLLTERNARWVERIRDMLDRNRATFVCVGLGHLVGGDSIQVHLQRAGFAVTVTKHS